MSEPLLSVEGVEAGYGNMRALANITLHVEAGEIVTLVGANGAGKTTTLRALSGLIHPWKGVIRFGGEDISRLSPHEIVERGIAHVPEGRRLFPQMTVEENLALGAYSRRARERAPETREELLAAFPRVKERLHQRAGTLSGGEQQMVAIARGLMAQPRLLLLDEPSLGLAPKINEELFAKVAEIGKRGITVLIVEQNVVDVLSISSRGYVIENGEVDQTVGSSAQDLLNNERLRAAYFGL